MIMRKGGMIIMKKFSKMLALGLTLAMTFSMTAFAAESPTTGNVDTTTAETVTTPTTDVSKVESDSEATVTETVKGVEVEEVKAEDLSAADKAEYEAASAGYYKALDTSKLAVTSDTKLPEGTSLTTGQLDAAKTATAVKAAEKLADALGLDLADGKTAKDAIQAAFDLSLVNADKTAASIDGSIKVVLPVKVTPKEGKKYIVLHQGLDGKWETVESEVKADGTIVAKFTSLSPVAIVEVQAKDGDDDDDDDTTVTTTVAAATESGKSPKTAETASAAGMIALMAVAGAAAASRKIRYNN
jgi:hypothetical protein